jgi:NTP pyrophosphatase (non-canonical NTP hydrolase)
MNLNEYQAYAMRFRLPSADEEYVVMNLPSEVGEFFGHCAKYVRDMQNPSEQDDENLRQTLLKELGDILWTITAISDDLGSSLDEIANINVNKLTGRSARGTLQGSGDER